MRIAVALVALVALACSAQPTASVSPRASNQPGPTPSSTPFTPGPVFSPIPMPTPSFPASTGGIVEYAVPKAPRLPADCPYPCAPGLGSITRGPDGNVWYVDQTRRLVGKVTPAGNITQFVVPYPYGGAHTITAGRDGNVWLTGRDQAGNQDVIVRITSSGALTMFPVGKDVALTGITIGPDGNIWFTGGLIGRLSPTGAVTGFSVGGQAIATGPDGDLWTTASGGLIRLTTSGHADFVAVPIPEAAEGRDIIVGPDGLIWLAAVGGLYRVNPKTLAFATKIPLPAESNVEALAAGPDGNVWFTDSNRSLIGRVSVSGAIRYFPLPRRDASPQGIAVGGDGRIWFTESYGARIGSIGAKVPMATFSRRVVTFAGASTQTLTVTNTGDAALVIQSVRTGGADSGYFAITSDRCSGVTVAAGSRCELSVVAAGDTSALRAGVLQIYDNATRSPQLVSLVANLDTCRLPVVTNTQYPAVPQGQLLNTTTGVVSPDPKGGFTNTAASGVRITTASKPTLVGGWPGYFETRVNRWLPVSDANAISQDASRYAYVSYKDDSIEGTLHVVDIASGRDRALKLRPAPWVVVAFAKEGIYLHTGYESIGEGLILVNPDTGAVRTVLKSGVVYAVTSPFAWLGSFNRADKLPNPNAIQAANTITRRNLVTGAVTTWLYRPGTGLYLNAVVDGAPIVMMRTWSGSRYLFVSAPNTTQPISLPFTNDREPYLHGFVSDMHGTWIGTQDGIYLWTSHTGGVLVSDFVGVPAGVCA